MEFQIVISLNEAGQFKVEGIQNNEITMYGALAKAQKVIEDYFAQQKIENQKRIMEVPPGADVRNLKVQ